MQQAAASTIDGNSSSTPVLHPRFAKVDHFSSLALAFIMGTHGRLGQESIIYALENDVVRMIAEMVFYVPDAAEQFMISFAQRVHSIDKDKDTVWLDLPRNALPEDMQHDFLLKYRFEIRTNEHIFSEYPGCKEQHFLCLVATTGILKEDCSHEDEEQLRALEKNVIRHLSTQEQILMEFCKTEIFPHDKAEILFYGLDEDSLVAVTKEGILALCDLRIEDDGEVDYDFKWQCAEMSIRRLSVVLWDLHSVDLDFDKGSSFAIMVDMADTFCCGRHGFKVHSPVLSRRRQEGNNSCLCLLRDLIDPAVEPTVSMSRLEELLKELVLGLHSQLQQQA